MEGSRGPQPLSKAISEVIALRGLANAGADAQVAAAWKDVAAAVAGEALAAGTRATTINRGTLQVSVNSAPLLGEVVSFHKPQLIKLIKDRYPHLKVRDIKFRLKGDLKK